MVVPESDLREGLEGALRGWERTVILGVGNELDGDDGVGLLVAQTLRETLAGTAGVEVLVAGTAPENFTGVLRRLCPSHVLIVDAAEMGEQAGTIRLIQSDRTEVILPSTHALGMSMISKYLQEELGSDVVILGVQPKELSFGAALSAEVLDSASRIVHAVEQLMASPRERPDDEGVRSHSGCE
jgi:hydrogenase 3 maturation protease